MDRRVFLATSVASITLLSACAGLPTAELEQLGSKITPAKIDFNDIYSYAERSSLVYASESAIRAKYTKIVRMNTPGQSQVRYFLERDDKAHTQIITIRGTNNNKNLSEDMNISVRDDRKIAIPVHAGFDNAARAVHADAKPYLTPGYKTYVTGHSLGAAVAALLAIYLMEDGYTVERVVTFGQPRFTTTSGASHLTNLPLTRIVDENDIVPLVPPSFISDPIYGPFDQVGSEVILLDGPEFVFLPSHDATRIALGEFWRSLTYADLQDHEMHNYLRRIASKTKGASEVPYLARLRYEISSAADLAH